MHARLLLVLILPVSLQFFVGLPIISSGRRGLSTVELALAFSMPFAKQGMIFFGRAFDAGRHVVCWGAERVHLARSLQAFLELGLLPLRSYVRRLLKLVIILVCWRSSIWRRRKVPK